MQKRRERINERLKVLQNLVPNGTKASLYQWLETKKELAIVFLNAEKARKNEPF
jgi:hypothetical protein